MQIRSLRNLVQVSRVHSFAKAAEQLNMTLSALSMQMKSLETELGVTLFDRSVRPPRLTPIGRSVVEEALPLLRSEDRLLKLCQPSDALIGRFRIGFVSTAAVRLLPGFLQRAKRKAPQAMFEFETGLSRDLQSKVVHGQIDAAIVTDADGLPERLTASVIRQEPFVFAAHRQLLENGRAGLFADHRFFHFMPDTGIGKLIAGEMKNHRRPDTARTIVLDNLEAIMECVSGGLGFTLLPEPDVDRYRPATVEKLPCPGPLHRRLVLVTTEDGALATGHAELAGLLREDALARDAG